MDNFPELLSSFLGGAFGVGITTAIINSFFGPTYQDRLAHKKWLLGKKLHTFSDFASLITYAVPRGTRGIKSDIDLDRVYKLDLNVIVLRIFNSNTDLQDRMEKFVHELDFFIGALGIEKSFKRKMNQNEIEHQNDAFDFVVNEAPKLIAAIAKEVQSRKSGFFKWLSL